MKRIGSLLLYGFLTWFVALAVSMAAYPLKKSQDPLFETVMTLALASLAVLATLAYFHRVRRYYLLEGFLLGASLFLVNIVLDLPLFMFGPLAMPLRSYVGDIGLTYLVYPIVTVGSGVLVSAVLRARSAEAAADVAALAPLPEPATALPVAAPAATSPAAAPAAAGVEQPAEAAVGARPESGAALDLPVA